MDVVMVKTIAITAVIFSVVVVLPLVALFLEHQRKMARLIRGEEVDESDSPVVVGLQATMGVKPEQIRVLTERISHLEVEVAELRTTLPARVEEELRARSELRS